MVGYRIVAFVGFAAALPLNINLGAYSPALVVGDGEISFGGKQDVSSLMNVLEGAAVNAAAGAANGAAAAPAAVAPVAAASVASAPAVQAAPAAAPATPATASTDATLATQAQQIAALQGMGKEIAPRVEIINTPDIGKRDLAGFDRALKYAEAALVKGPKIQLGTGEGGSGVGILVDNNPTAAARPGKGAAAEGAAAGGAAGGAAVEGGAKPKAARKRDVDDTTAPRRRAKVTTMYVRQGIPASLQSSSEIEGRAVDTALSAPSIPLQQAAALLSRRDAIDAVNLNVDGKTGVTMTFVETVDDADDE